MKLSDAGLAFLANEEGFRDHVYMDAGGRATVGYGHLVKEGETFGAVISRQAARALLAADVAHAEGAVNDLVTGVELTQPQFDALVSLVFNIGVGAFAKSTLLRVLNMGSISAAAAEFPRWRMVGDKVNAVLEARRMREMRMFLGDDA